MQRYPYAPGSFHFVEESKVETLSRAADLTTLVALSKCSGDLLGGLEAPPSTSSDGSDLSSLYANSSALVPQGSASAVPQPQQGMMYMPQGGMYMQPQQQGVYMQQPGGMYAPQQGMYYAPNQQQAMLFQQQQMQMQAGHGIGVIQPGNGASQPVMSSVAPPPKKKEDRFSFVNDVMSQARQ
jgi:hypothetical protein